MNNLGCILRVDNVLRPGTHNNFRSMMEVVNRQKAICVIDVTPRWHGEENSNKEYISFIKEQLEKGHVLALHGVEHKCRVLSEKDHQVSWLPSEDEFDCKDYHRIHGKDIPVNIQRGWLREGNDYLQKMFGQKADLLMAPAHAYNNNTLEAMKKEGFVAIADYGRWDACPYNKEGVTTFPFDFEDYMKNTKPDGSNKDAMMEMFRRYFDASINQQGYYATFIHCDFSNDGSATEERLKFLDEMISYVHNQGHKFVDPHKMLIKK